MGGTIPPKGWVSLSVREEVRKQLEELASKLGMASPNDVISYLLDKYREFTDISVRLEKLLTDISVRLTDISVKLEKHTTTSSGNALPTAVGERLASDASMSLTAVRDDSRPTTVETSTVKVGEQKPQTHTWCRKKDSVKYLKAFLDWVDRNYKVVDWWEEGDSYCFETEKPPKS